MFIRIAAAAIGKKNRTNRKNKMYHSAHFERETFSFFLNRTIMIRIFKDVICLHFKENAVWKHFFLLLLSCVSLFLLLLLTVDRNSGQVFAFTRRGPRDCFDYTLLSTSDQWDGHENVCGHTHTHRFCAAVIVHFLQMSYFQLIEMKIANDWKWQVETILCLRFELFTDMVFVVAAAVQIGQWDQTSFQLALDAFCFFFVVFISFSHLTVANTEKWSACLKAKRNVRLIWHQIWFCE